ncbi:MAG: hypothetical protein ACLQU1_02895 [Bryobacteraceae bacterium]
MTIEERYEKMERNLAGSAEERRQFREEWRRQWRENQRILYELTLKIADITDAIARPADEPYKKFDRRAEEWRAADKRLGERIDALAAAIGKWVADNRASATEARITR